MAKRDRIFADRSLTIDVNDVVLEYLEDLAKTGLYGNTHEEAAKLVLRHGLAALIEGGKLEIKRQALSRDGSGEK